MSLLVVGSLAFDSIETPFGKVENALGGSATYISIAIVCVTNSCPQQAGVRDTQLR